MANHSINNGASFSERERQISSSRWRISMTSFASRDGSTRIFPSIEGSDYFDRTISRSSSHLCDHEEDDNGDGFEDVKVDDTVIVVKDVENQIQVKPPVRKPKKSRLSVILLDQGLFTVYKRLFIVSLVVNIVLLILAVAGEFGYGKRNATVFSIGNILCLVLCRSEVFLRVVLWLAVKVLGRPFVPLFVKTATTSFLQSVGGIHSGCGLSSVAWLTYALVQTLRNRESVSTEILVVGWIIFGLLLLSSAAAFPLVRHLHHNVFEMTHRLAGWTALALVWTFNVLSTGYNPTTRSYSNLTGQNLVRQEAFWLTIAITFLIILPWVTVKKVKVEVTAPSGHASLIKFKDGVKPGILGRISRSPLSEWHAFGIISDGKDSHMMLAGAVGDFTKGLVTDPPTHLWVRGVHFAGLPYLVNMYNRVVLVATGSGICVFLSFLLQPCKANVCLLWVTKGVEENFGREIKGMLSGFDKDKVIVHDTAVSGRPNVAELTVSAAKNWKAEVVVVTSNPEGSRDVVTASKAAGFAAFGPIWDS